MDKDSLLRMLDLQGHADKSEELVVRDEETTSQGGEPQLHALVLDDWDIERGRVALAHCPAMRGLTEEAAADFHAAAYVGEPELVEVCADARRHEFLKTLMETPEYRAIRTSTMFNDAASEMAASEFAVQFLKLVEKDKVRKPTGNKERDEARASSTLLGAVAAALKDASEVVEEYDDAVNAMGLGGDGADPKTMDPAQVAYLFKRIRGNALVKRICELAGKFRRVAQSKQRNKVTHGYDDMVGVVMDGDVSRLLPLEMAQLADEDFELDAMRRLVERQSFCREYRGMEHVAKGPVVICVDESGSMDGEPVCNAKAFALAMAWIARKQGRWCSLIGFAGGTEGTRLALPPGKWDEVKLIDWLGHFFGGGTDMDVPLVELPTTYWNELKAPRGKTDVILITDAQVRVPSKMRDDFLAWKQREQVRCISLVIGSSAGDLKQVSDEVFLVNGIDVQSEAVGKCFAI